jgi:hypothetical protein
VKTIELNRDDLIHLMRGGAIEFRRLEIVVCNEDSESVKQLLPTGTSQDRPLPPIKAPFRPVGEDPLT